jgi:predicted nucleotidyltransferase
VPRIEGQRVSCSSSTLGDAGRAQGLWSKWGIIRRMDRAELISKLQACAPELAARFGVKRLALFGSFARDAARSDSDVDVLVDFGGPATPEAYFGVQFYLEDHLGFPVDLVTERALRPQLRPYVERDAIIIA